MNNSFLKQLWLAARIWLLALATNTLLGTFYLTEFFTSPHEIPDFLVVGTVYGAVFSFPIMVILLIIINRCMATHTNGLLLFLIVFGSGIVLTVIMFLIFWAAIGGYNNDMGMLLTIAVLSGIVGMITFHRSLLKSGSEFNNAQKV
jgi:hypothetical protein